MSYLMRKPLYVPGTHEDEAARDIILAVLSKPETDLLTIKEISTIVGMQENRVGDHLSHMNKYHVVSSVKISRKSESLWAKYHPALSQRPLDNDIVNYIHSKRGTK